MGPSWMLIIRTCKKSDICTYQVSKQFHTTKFKNQLMISNLHRGHYTSGSENLAVKLSKASEAMRPSLMLKIRTCKSNIPYLPSNSSTQRNSRWFQIFEDTIRRAQKIWQKSWLRTIHKHGLLQLFSQVSSLRIYHLKDCIQSHWRQMGPWFRMAAVSEYFYLGIFLS